MPLNILLADDSVPAQNMGKKILVDAGYQVLTVSNGLEALRKIADAVPDIAILDIFMPGYSGLEICERLRASPATATLPVILTVGKLEPYRPQDGEQVHSNAVIVKPFAAAELVSAVRSLIGAPPAVEESHPGESPARTQDSHNALTVDPAEPQFAGASQEPDEPLFAMGPSATQVQRDDPFFSKDGPESLVFNPDAEHTPFSASVIDLLPVASHAPVAIDTSAFTEFDLEPEASHYSSAVLQVNPTAEQTTPAAPDAVAGTGLTASPAPAMVADAVIAPYPVASVSSGAAELESSSTLDIPARDPLLEVTEPETLGSDESSKAITSEVVEDAWTPSAPAVNQQDAARRLAFEELFNSTVPFPVEDSPVTSSESRTVILPSMADLSKDHPFDVVQDSEIESLVVDQPQLIAPEPDPYLMQEEEPLSTIGEIPKRDPRLEVDFEPDLSEVAVVPWQAETTFDVSGDSHSVADERNELTAVSSIDAPTPETQDLAVEADAAEAEIPAMVRPAETVETASLSPVEESQFVPEVEAQSELTAPPNAEPAETQNAAVETDSAEPDIPATVHPAEIVETASVSPVEESQFVPGVEAQRELTAQHGTETAETQNAAVETDSAEPDIPATVYPANIVETASVSPVEESQLVPKVETHSELTPPPGADAPEMQNVPVETNSAAPDIPAIARPAEIVETAREATVEQAQIVPVVLLPAVHETAPEKDLHPETKTEPAAEIPLQLQPETAPVPEMQAAQSASAPEVMHRSSEAERLHQAVERVFDRFKPLLVAAIVRELARHD